MLDISPVILLGTSIIFLLVLARLNSCLYKPLLKHMDERAESIQKDLEAAKSNSADVDGLLSQANEIIANAKKEAAAIRELASTEAKKSADERIASAKADVEKKYLEFASDLETQKQSLKESLKSQLPQFKTSLQAKLSSI